MAGETDAASRRAQEGWNAFSKFMFVSTAGVIIALGLMAIFLL